MTQEFPPRHTIKNELDAAEIRKLEAELAICVEDNDGLRAEIERLQRVIIEVPRDIQVGDSMIRELRTEVERLRAALQQIADVPATFEAKIEMARAALEPKP